MKRKIFNKVIGHKSPGYIYGTCKIHKNVSDPPFRPVISTIPTPAYEVSKVLNKIISIIMIMNHDQGYLVCCREGATMLIFVINYYRMNARRIDFYLEVKKMHDIVYIYMGLLGTWLWTNNISVKCCMKWNEQMKVNQNNISLAISRT